MVFGARDNIKNARAYDIPRVSRSGNSVDLPCQYDINIRDAAAVVGGQGDLGVAPAEGDVRVVVGGLGEGSDGVYKGEAFGKICKREPFSEDLALGCPAVERF